MLNHSFLPRTATQKELWQRKFDGLKMKSCTDPFFFLDKVDEVVNLLELLGIEKDNAAICLKRLDGLFHEYDHEKRMMRVILNSYSWRNNEKLARRRYTYIQRSPKPANTNHAQAVVVCKSKNNKGVRNNSHKNTKKR